MRFFFVGVDFLVLVWDSTFFECDPGALDEWAELHTFCERVLIWLVIWDCFLGGTHPTAVEDQFLRAFVQRYGLCGFACRMREDGFVWGRHDGLFFWLFVIRQ